MPPRISVVVPLYNVAAYLETCLESLAQQTARGLEIVMVDDGSTDETPRIAERFVSRDSRFRLVRQANAGLGAARNTGTAQATGDFLAFVDSDDVVPRHAYEVLSGALEQTGSDFATGNVRRLTSFGTSQAAFLAEVFRSTRLRTHVTRFPALIVDRTAWNKLFRRSFWDRHGFRFPEGVLYEDIPVILPAHHLARSVDVLDQTVYLWRVREGEDLSITQRRTEPKALRDRVSAVDYVSRFLAARGWTAAKRRYDSSVLRHDLMYFLDVVDGADDEFRSVFLDLVNDFLDRADPAVLDQPLAIDRLKWELVRRRALPELLEVLRFEDEDLPSVAPVRRRRRWYADYPYRDDRRLGIPSRVYRLRDELALVSDVNELRWEGESLRIEGHAHIDLIGAGRPGAQTVELLIRRAGSRRRPRRVRARVTRRPDVTADADQEIADLSWSGFVATVDGDVLKRGARWRDGTWEIGVAVRAGGIRRTTWEVTAAPLHPPPTARLPLPDGGYVRAGLTGTGDFDVRVHRFRPLVRSYRLDDGVLELEGDPGLPTSDEVTLQVSRRGETAHLDYPVHVDASAGRPSFLARVPFSDLVGRLEVADEAAHTEYEGDGVAWDVYLITAFRRRMLLDESLREAAWTFEGREVGVSRTRRGNVTLVERSFRPVIEQAEWTKEGTLVLEGEFRGPEPAYDLVLSGRRRAEMYAVPLAYDAAAGRFSTELTPAAVPSLAGPRPLGEGVWELLVGPRGRAHETAVHVVFDHELLATLPKAARVERKRFRFGVLGYRMPVLSVDRDLADHERGGFAQRRLRTAFYPSRRARRLREAVLYDCFGGAEYSDSPRAIHEELVRRKAPLEHVWVVRDGAFRAPPTALPVPELSEDYYEAYARARYVVANDFWPRWAVRRAEQAWIQTWHGAPLKQLGLELVRRPKAVAEYRRARTQTRGNWQFVVSPGPFATPILTRAFPIDGDVIETGLPRTDLLLTPDAERTAADVRRRLGLSPDARVVLYAPTYRDHLGTRGGYRPGPLLDFDVLEGALGEECTVLFRKHRAMVGAVRTATAGVLDVTTFPDVNELLLVADVLVTDYSSAIFDFAVTRRPIVFFVPDLEAYRDDIRGFSIPFEDDVPGPLLGTTAEVIEALRRPEDVASAYRARYERFVAKYLPLADGRASARVVDHVFGA